MIASLVAGPYLLGVASILLALRLGVPFSPFVPSMLAPRPPLPLPVSTASSSSTQPTPPIHPLISIEPPLDAAPAFADVNVTDVLYGPFTTAARSMRPEEILIDIPKPCNDCFLTAMGAELRAPHIIGNGSSGSSGDNSVLYADSGLSLHHLILFNQNQPDLVCPQYGERLFGSGAERWTRRFGRAGTWGYRVRPGDRWDAVVELMNGAAVPREAMIAVRFEWVHARHPAAVSMREVHVAWLDITGCGRAAWPARSATEAFAYATPRWVASVNGTLLDVRIPLPFLVEAEEGPGAGEDDG